MSARHKPRTRHPYTMLLLAMIVELVSVAWLMTHMGQATPLWSCLAFLGMTCGGPLLAATAFTDEE